MKKLKCVFMGTPEFSVPTLDMLFHHPLVELKHVVSMPDRKKGRGQKLQSPEVIEFAKANKISFFQTSNINREDEILKQLESDEIDFIVVLAFSQFLGSKVLNLPKQGCFNIHTSILPKYRGAAPIQYALLNGDTQTGVSIQKMVKKMDAGDLVAYKNVSISNNETGGQLYSRLKFEAALCLNDFLNELYLGKVTYTPQDEKDVSFAPTLKKEDGFLSFKTQSFNEIRNRIRALDPWPGTYCFLGGKRLKVLSIEKENRKVEPGTIDLSLNSLVVGCTDSSLRLCDIQLEGKKACSDIELLNGLKNSPEKIVLTNADGVPL